MRWVTWQSYGASLSKLHNFNIGPAACTGPHEGIMNLSWGWCTVSYWQSVNLTVYGSVNG